MQSQLCAKCCQSRFFFFFLRKINLKTRTRWLFFFLLKIVEWWPTDTVFLLWNDGLQKGKWTLFVCLSSKYSAFVLAPWLTPQFIFLTVCRSSAQRNVHYLWNYYLLMYRVLTCPNPSDSGNWSALRSQARKTRRSFCQNYTCHFLSGDMSLT